MLRSSAQHPSRASASYAMARMPGATPLLPAREEGRLGPREMGSGYRLSFNVDRADAEAYGTVNYEHEVAIDRAIFEAWPLG